MDNTLEDNDLEDFFASSKSDTGHSEYKSNNVGNVEDGRFAYSSSTWSKTHAMYDPISTPFAEPTMDLTGKYNEIPSYVWFFEIFWTFNMLRDICVETNLYAG
jgi:hypothetical protein